MFIRNKISYLITGTIITAYLAVILFFNYEKKDTSKAEVAALGNATGFVWSGNIG